MIVDPRGLNASQIEEIELLSLRLVTQAILDFLDDATTIFANEKDLVADIGEDITREALDRMGVSRIDGRLFGKMDYKRARYVFHPSYVVRQALFIDSKAEKIGGQDTATLQTAQTSMRMRHVRAGVAVDEEGKLPTIHFLAGKPFLTTTLFVKYHYQEGAYGYTLANIILAALPNGVLQEIYNPSAEDTIWRTGRNAPSRGEAFRVRLVFDKLKSKARWRIQKIHLSGPPFEWDS